MFSELSFDTACLPQSRGILDSVLVPKSAQPNPLPEPQLPSCLQQHSLWVKSMFLGDIKSMLGEQTVAEEEVKCLWRRHSTGTPGEEKLYVGLLEVPRFTCYFGMDDHQTCFEGPKITHAHHTCEKNRCQDELPPTKTSLCRLGSTWEQYALRDPTFQPQKF